MTFGQRFKELRIEKGFTQQELADDFNSIYGYTFTKSSISQYENDKKIPEINALKNFALYFNVSMDYLLGLSDDIDIEKPEKEIDLGIELIEVFSKFVKDDNTSLEDKEKMKEELDKIFFSSLK